MKFLPTILSDTFIIEPELLSDERGFFARTFCVNEFTNHGLNPKVVQCNLSSNSKGGTLRGMHFQKGPAGEAKLVRCVRGAIHDVVVDLRPESPTYRQSYAVQLTMENRRALYIPESFGHGFQTLVDDTEVEYQMSAFHAPQHARGFRYDDAAFSIRWPRPVSMISTQDLNWLPFS